MKIEDEMAEDMNRFNPLDLKTRTILVTGASSGIGRATSIYLSKLGAHIVLNGRNEEQLNVTLSLLFGDGHAVCATDLTTSENLEGLFDAAVCDGRKLDGLVHCAGIPCVMPLRVLDRKHLTEIMDSNFYSFVELIRQYSKKKYSTGGSIVGISSILSVQPRGYEAGYIASKGAMNAAIGSLAFELAPRKIRINGILAGNIMTEMAKRTLEQFDNKEHFQEVIENSLLGLGEPDDIASVCAFLISDMSRFITGRLIYADGGLL